MTAAEIARLYADSKFVKKAPVAKKMEAPEAGLLLSSSFDKFTTQPDYIANPVSGYLSGIQHELQLRMYKGVNNKGNAVLLNNSEFIGYRANGNFNARQGSLLLWVKPLNWKSSARGFFQVFFEVREKDYRFVLYKLNSGDQIAAYIKSGKKTHLLSYNSVKWNPGQWHQLAVTWNSSGARLYIDGVPPRQGSLGEKVFKENPDFPAELKWGTIWLNPSRGWVTNKEWTTAYDDLKIYNLVLSPAEILTAYEKVMPSQKKNILPLTSLPVTLPVINPVPGSVELQKTPTVSLSLRDKNLIADFAVPYPAVNYNLRERDGKLWLNDGVEIHVLGNDGQKRQFMINPAWTLYDSLNGNAKWNSQAKVSVKIGNGQWSASASIPLADLGVTGNSFKANFCISAGSGKKWNYTWSPVTDPLSGFADVKYFGEVSLLPSPGKVELSGLGDLRAGELDVRLTAPAGTNMVCTYSAPGGFSGKGLKAKLPAGRNEIIITGTAAGKKFFRYVTPVNVNPPMTMNLVAYPGKKKLECRIDFSASGLRKGEGVVTMTANGKEYSRAGFKTLQPEYTAVLPLPDTLPDNTDYTVTVTMGYLRAKRIFRVPDTSLFDTRTAIDHTVPAPWTPVKVSGNRIQVRDRVYDLPPAPSPRQSLHGAKRLLKDSPYLS